MRVGLGQIQYNAIFAIVANFPLSLITERGYSR